MIYLLLRPSARTRENAVALLIVLAFLVLLAGLTVAYLSRTGTDRQIAQSSFNDAKSDQLARSALDMSDASSLRNSSEIGSDARCLSIFDAQAPFAKLRKICGVDVGQPLGPHG